MLVGNDGVAAAGLPVDGRSTQHPAEPAFQRAPLPGRRVPPTEAAARAAGTGGSRAAAVPETPSAVAAAPTASAEATATTASDAAAPAATTAETAATATTSATARAAQGDPTKGAGGCEPFNNFQIVFLAVPLTRLLC